MTATQRILACALAGILWLAAIALKHVWPDVEVGGFVLACGSVITALGVHGATVGNAIGPFVTGSVTAPAGGQGGFARLSLLAMLAGIALSLTLISGCTTTTGSMYAALATQAKAGVQVFDDNSLATIREVICAQPYSAIQRHPELQPGVVALCGPLANTASLDPNQIAQMLGIVKQLGLVPALPPAAAASGAK